MTRIDRLQAWLDRHLPSARRASHMATCAALVTLGCSAAANLATVFLRGL